MANLLKNARDRPHNGHRLYLRTLNFGVRFAFAIMLFLAIIPALISKWKT